MGSASASSGIPATASTASWAGFEHRATEVRVHPGAARRDGRVHGRAPTPNSPAKSASAWPPPAPAPSICSTASTTPSMDHQPVVAIVGQPARTAMGGDYQQEVDLQIALQGRRARIRPRPPSSPAQMRHLIDRAFRIALARAHASPASSSPTTCRRRRGRDAAAQTRHHPFRHRLLGAAGRAARRGSASAPRTCSTPARRSRCWSARVRCSAADEVIAVADLLGAGIAKALLGKARAAGRPAVRHRLHRPARHQAELGR